MTRTRTAGTGSAPNPRWAMYTVWAVVNAVCLLQAAGFVSRVVTGDRDFNHVLGWVIVALAVPAAAALAAFIRRGVHVRWLLGPAAFIVFVLFELPIDYLWPVEFRDPALLPVLIPYLTLFFGSVFLMGAPMYRVDRRFWAATLMSTLVLLASMSYAMANGVG